MREVRIRLDAADLSRLRWAVSPAWELLASLRVLADPGAHAVHMPWLTRHRGDPILTSPEARAVRDLVVHRVGLLPGFLAPTPESPLADIEDELALVAATPAEVVRREMAALWPSRPPESLRGLVASPRDELRRIVAELRAYWSRAVEPTWPVMRGLLERDIHGRATMLADRGPGEMLNDLHEDVHWDGASGRLVVANRLADVSEPDRTLTGRGLVLVPSVFAWPRAYAKTVEPWVPVLRYPARGVGMLWDPPAAPHDVAAALGATRAHLLQLLEVPSTTDQLARAMRRSPGGVSVQLHRLVAAGLATHVRVGRHVYYARTVRGEAVLT